MIEPALSKAKIRLALVERAFANLQEVGTGPAFQTHWLDYITNWKGAYSKVEQAVKATPQERQWFGAVNKERKGDPLLRWIFAARNDEEHGLINSAVVLRELRPFRVKKTVVVSAMRRHPNGTTELLDESGNPVDVEWGEPQDDLAHLHPVSDRDGTQIPAPESHAGKPIESKPLIVAELGLRWLHSLLATADALHKP